MYGLFQQNICMSCPKIQTIRRNKWILQVVNNNPTEETGKKIVEIDLTETNISHLVSGRDLDDIRDRQFHTKPAIPTDNLIVSTWAILRYSFDS